MGFYYSIRQKVETSLVVAALLGFAALFASLLLQSALIFFGGIALLGTSLLGLQFCERK